MLPEDIEELKKSTDPRVQALLEEYLEYTTDPTKKFFLECSRMVNVISDDMKTIREVDKQDEESIKEANLKLKILGSNKDDKMFDRVMSVLSNSGKIIDNIRILQGQEPKKGRRGQEKKDDIPTTFD